jgi:hypothetical protein
MFSIFLLLFGFWAFYCLMPNEKGDKKKNSDFRFELVANRFPPEAHEPASLRQLCFRRNPYLHFFLKTKAGTLLRINR